MSVNAFDEALAIPSQFAQTVSVRTQQIIQLESGLTKIVDPLGGSYAIERLTDEVEARAREIFTRLEALPPQTAWESITNACRDAAYARQLAVDTGERPVVGVNCFVDEDETDLDFGEHTETRADYDPAYRDKQIARLERVKDERDPVRWEAARARLIQAYRERESIIEPTLEAVEAYMSIGEIVEALASVEGEQAVRKRGGFIIRLY